MEHKGSLPCSQVSATGCFPKPGETRPHTHISSDMLLSVCRSQTGLFVRCLDKHVLSISNVPSRCELLPVSHYCSFDVLMVFVEENGLLSMSLHNFTIHLLLPHLQAHVFSALCSQMPPTDVLLGRRFGFLEINTLLPLT
jgi:hypothetical protein